MYLFYIAYCALYDYICTDSSCIATHHACSYTVTVISIFKRNNKCYPLNTVAKENTIQLQGHT